MKKNVMTVGFDIPGDVAESISFRSGRSLLDADLVIFAPDLDEYENAYPQTYQGKRRIADDDSATLMEDAAHWKNELRAVLENGMTVFVMLVEVPDVFVFSGQVQVSGTGRNAQRTFLVRPFEPYSAVPGERLSQEVRRRMGERIKATKDLGALASYWQAFGDFSYYQIYLEKPVGTAALVTQTGDKMVGGIVRFKDLPGRMVLLPPVNFAMMVKARQKGKDAGQANRTASKGGASENAAERGIGSQFVGALIEIDKTTRAHSDRTPSPLWAQAGGYALTEEDAARKQIADLDDQIVRLRERKKAAEAGLHAAANLKGLLFESGKPLESAILEALRTLLFTAEQYKDSESEFDVVFHDHDGARLIGEAEGKNDKAINIEKLDQLERNVREEFQKREDSVYAKPVLFGNAFRLSPPAERGNYFTDKCVAGAKRSGVALIRTPDLFEVARYLKQNPDPAFAALCRKAILETSGDVVKFPSVPRSERPEVVAGPLR